MTSKTIETTLGLNTQPSSKRWKKIAGVSLALVMIAAASFYTMKYTAKKETDLHRRPFENSGSYYERFGNR